MARPELQITGRARRALLPVMSGGALALVVLLAAPLAAGAQQTGAARGAEVFAQNCQVCHGVMAQGRVGPPIFPIPPQILALSRPELLQALTGLVREGIPGAMPRFLPEQVGDADVEALLDFLVEANATVARARTYYEALQPVPPSEDTEDRIYFPDSGHTLSLGFKRFWEENGGLELFGLPISEEYVGYSPIDGEPRTMQAFERVRFEYHPELVGTPGEVQLVPLGLEERMMRTFFVEREGPPEESEAPGGS